MASSSATADSFALPSTFSSIASSSIKTATTQSAATNSMGAGASNSNAAAQSSGAAGVTGLSQRSRQLVCADCEKALPNQIVFDKIELIIRRMQDEQNGLPVKTAKSFMSKIPSVFTGTDLIQWMMKNLQLDDQAEAIHLANLIASHGYIFPIEDHTLSIKNDCTFYRFQTPCLWPSNNIEPENTDYAVYLCKRTMQGKTRLELADYEAENLARLQKMFSRKWEFIFMQAEAQAKVDKKRDKLERKVLDSQERAFWDVYRPVPGCVNTTEMDIKKACRLSKSAKRCTDCQKNFLQGTSGSSAQQRSQSQSHQTSLAPATQSTQQQPQQVQQQQTEADDTSETKAQDESELVVDEEQVDEELAGEKKRQAAAAVDPSSPHPSPVDGGSVESGSPLHLPETPATDQQNDPPDSAEPKTTMSAGDNASQQVRSAEQIEETDEREQEEKDKEKGKEKETEKERADCEQASSASGSKAGHKHHHHHHHHHHHSHPHQPSGQHSRHHHAHHSTQQQQQQHQHHHHPHQHPHHHHSHHHHHHHHRQCPHHAAKAQQQQQQQQQGASEEKSAESSSQPATGSSEPPARHRKHAPHCSRRRLAGSFDQSSVMGSVAPNTTATTSTTATSTTMTMSQATHLLPSATDPKSNVVASARRKSECTARAMSMTVSEPASTQVERSHDRYAPSVCELSGEPDEAPKAQSQSRLTATQSASGTGNESCERPASACSSLASLGQSQRLGPAPSATPGARKSSLRITRSPSEQVTSTSSATSSVGALSGATVIDAAAASSDRLKRSGHAQLKGAQSVCAAPSASAGSAATVVQARRTVANSTSDSKTIAPAAAANQTSKGAITAATIDSDNLDPSAAFIGDLERELETLRVRLERRIGGVKMSKVTQSYLSYFKQWAEYDPFIAQPIPSNPWCSDSTELWDSERQTKDVHCRRVRRWAFSLKELLNDPAGREQFYRFLEKEFSAENLKFWDAVQELKRVHSKDVARRVEAIWTEYLAQDANCPINIDSKSYETSKKNMAKNKNNRYIFDEAAGHVYQLMKNDSYPRYLRSDMYKDYKEASERKRTNQVAFDVFKPQISNLKHKFNF